MSSTSPSQLTDLHAQDWSALLHPPASTSASPATTASPTANSQAAAAQPSPSNPSERSASSASGEPSSSSRSRRSLSSNVANLLTLTELRKAAWARIYFSGIRTGDASISTSHVPTWKQFDALMMRRHRYIAVDPRDNRTLGWIACFHPHAQWAYLYDDDRVGSCDDGKDGREARVAEVQVMVAEAERGKGVGKFLVKAVLASLRADRGYSMVQASFFKENDAAQSMFERCGFEVACERMHAVKMLDGPSKGGWRDLVTVEYKLPPLQASHQHQQQQPSTSTDSPTAINTTIDPTALLKRPRLG